MKAVVAEAAVYRIRKCWGISGDFSELGIVSGRCCHKKEAFTLIVKERASVYFQEDSKF